MPKAKGDRIFAQPLLFHKPAPETISNTAVLISPAKWNEIAQGICSGKIWFEAMSADQKIIMKAPINSENIDTANLAVSFGIRIR